MMHTVPEYARPASLEAALALLARPIPVAQPLAGGTYLALTGADAEALIDLADLGLAGIHQDGDRIILGAMTTLQALADSAEICPTLRRAAQREAPRNIRNQATVGGAVALGASGPLLACLLALDARLLIEPGGEVVALIDYLVRRKAGQTGGHIIVSLSFSGRRRLAYQEISRTPDDAPVMCMAAGAEIADGRLAHVAVACGGADQPLMPGREVACGLEGVAVAVAEDRVSEVADTWRVPWIDDTRGHGAYRRSMQPVLLSRAVVGLVAQAFEVQSAD